MKTLVLISALVAVCAALTPLDIEVEVNPRHTLKEWEQIMENQEFTEEVCEGCLPGSIPRPANAGRMVPITRDQRIIGGSEAKVGQFPWQVALYLDGYSFCGGTILNENWIMTAAHCADGIRNFRIYLGSHNINKNEENRVIVTTTNKVVHPEWDRGQLVNDIALLKLNEPIEFNAVISAIKLPSKDDVSNTYEGSSAIVSGWGKIRDSGSVNPTLQFVSLPVLSNQKCAGFFGAYIRNTHICGSGEQAKSACNGDSGGPFMVESEDKTLTQVGIVSFGAAGCKKYPSVFTRVTSYLQWIESTTRMIL